MCVDSLHGVGKGYEFDVVHWGSVSERGGPGNVIDLTVGVEVE